MNKKKPLVDEGEELEYDVTIVSLFPDEYGDDWDRSNKGSRDSGLQLRKDVSLDPLAVAGLSPK